MRVISSVEGHQETNQSPHNVEAVNDELVSARVLFEVPSFLFLNHLTQ